MLAESIKSINTSNNQSWGNVLVQVGEVTKTTISENLSAVSLSCSVFYVIYTVLTGLETLYRIGGTAFIIPAGLGKICVRYL
jgi:hypothetical protein